jgi:AcrR family transcriptional regulator
MASERMKGEERRRQIINAAIPVFARHGYEGAHMRDIARAADVSEALIYRHFPSKESLYDELLSYVRSLLATSTEELDALEPGTDTIIRLIYLLVESIMLDVPGRTTEQRAHERLLFQSLTGDIAFARNHFRTLEDAWADILVSSIEASTEEGDIIPVSTPPATRMWLTHHLAMALNLCHLSGEPAFEYEGSMEELAEQAVLFCLRGIGMTEKAIERHYKPRELRALRKRLFG